jgi:radical SAM protein with 4Fe4S-binding SPASM domain
MKKRWDSQYHYAVFFDPKTGKGARSNVYTELMEDTGKDPYRSSFPELLDIGIMGFCDHGNSGLCLSSGVQCYQKGGEIQEAHMTYETFKKIIDQAQHKTFQVALGGRGDPDQHPDIIKFLAYAYNHGITPNFTTSGYGLSPSLLPAIKQYCGAIAVSWYRNTYTLEAIRMLTEFGIKTNIHYVLSNSSIDEAIDLIEKDAWPLGINRVIFLLHKPVGFGSFSQVLDIKDPKVKHFFSLFDQVKIANKAGFDSCCVPAILNLTHSIDPTCIEACEAGRFSAYITPDNKLVPCSFEKDENYAVSLDHMSIIEAWESDVFNRFRSKQDNHCLACGDRESCFGGCPIVNKITLCDRVSRTLQENTL